MAFFGWSRYVLHRMCESSEIHVTVPGNDNIAQGNLMRQLPTGYIAA